MADALDRSADVESKFYRVIGRFDSKSRKRTALAAWAKLAKKHKRCASMLDLLEARGTMKKIATAFVAWGEYHRTVRRGELRVVHALGERSGKMRWRVLETWSEFARRKTRHRMLLTRAIGWVFILKLVISY